MTEPMIVMEYPASVAQAMASIVRTARAAYNSPHLAFFGEDRWTLRHPLSCLLDECAVHDAVDEWAIEPPGMDGEGYYEVSLEEEGLRFGRFLGKNPPPNPRDALRACVETLIQVETELRREASHE